MGKSKNVFSIKPSPCKNEPNHSPLRFSFRLNYLAFKFHLVIWMGSNWKHLQRFSKIYLPIKKIVKINKFFCPQCPRTDWKKTFLSSTKTITAWKLIPHRSKISENWNPPHCVPLHRFYKNWFLLIQKQLYSKVLLSKKVPNV